MVFSSNIFLFLFLPAFLASYYLSPPRWRNAVILIASYVFYAWWRVDFLVLFAGVTVWNYFIGQRIAEHIDADGVRGAGAKRWLMIGVVSDLAVLGYFKYANFGVDSFNALLVAAGFEPFALAQVILPIGISFYTFEAISYIVDVYRRDTKPARNFVDFACFVALFPHLIAGPVFRYKDLADQFNIRRHSADLFAEGAVRFMQGFVKKVFIADSIAPIADAGFALADPTTADAWLAVLAYTVQLYFDFSGYSDMAIGLGLMIGFRFVENFKQPYVSQSITEFWRRWHMSLSSWLRDYLYVPLGGNRHGTVATYRNLFLTMLLGGLWHGANWTFAIWGAWHGFILCVERALGVKAEPSGFRIHRWVLTMLFVMIGWTLFRAENIHAAMQMFSAMFRFDGEGLSPLYTDAASHLQIATLLLALAVLAWGGWRDRAAAAPRDATPVLRPWRTTLAVGLLLPLFAVAVLKLSAQSYSPFLYFQF